MKLSISDLGFSAAGYVCATIKVEVGKFAYPECTMRITAPLVEGKKLEQYKEEVLEKARERIARMYEEIVCGGSQVLKSFEIEITSPHRDNLEERVALLESHLRDAQTKPEVLNALHANIKNTIINAPEDDPFQAKGFGQQTGLKVTVSDKDDVLWMRDGSNQEGIVSLGYLKDGPQQRIIAALEDALFRAKGQVSCLSDDSVKVDFPVMRLSRYEPKGDSIFDFNKHERIGGNVQVKLVSGETATLYYEEDLDLKSTFEGYLNRAKGHAKSVISDLAKHPERAGAREDMYKKVVDLMNATLEPFRELRKG